jgi:putative cell wall-binding protein
MNNEKILLIHGFDYDEQLKLNEVLKENNLPLYKVIDETIVNLTIEEILINKEAGIVSTPVQKEKVVLFNQCSDEEIKTTMRAIKACYSQKPIFAVVTPTSINWKFDYLLEHLMEERSRFEKNT